MISLLINSDADDRILRIKNEGRIDGDYKHLVAEMATALHEFYKIDDGELLSIALEFMLEGVSKVDKRES